MSNTKTVLVLEDEVPLLTSIKIKLEKEGYSAIACKSYDEAILHLNEGTEVNLFWVDHYLTGGKTGLDFVSFVKKLDKYKKIPVFVVTNSEDYSNIILLMERIKGSANANQDTYLNYKVDKFFVKANSSLENIVSEAKKYLR